MSKVCPNCLQGDALYSAEHVIIMYPVRVDGDGEVSYEGEGETLYDTAEFEDDLTCRECDSALTLADLIDAPSGE